MPEFRGLAALVYQARLDEEERQRKEKEEEERRKAESLRQSITNWRNSLPPVGPPTQQQAGVIGPPTRTQAGLPELPKPLSGLSGLTSGSVNTNTPSIGSSYNQSPTLTSALNTVQPSSPGVPFVPGYKPQEPLVVNPNRENTKPQWNVPSLAPQPSNTASAQFGLPTVVSKLFENREQLGQAANQGLGLVQDWYENNPSKIYTDQKAADRQKSLESGQMGEEAEAWRTAGQAMQGFDPVVPGLKVPLAAAGKLIEWYNEPERLEGRNTMMNRLDTLSEAGTIPMYTPVGQLYNMGQGKKAYEKADSPSVAGIVAPLGGAINQALNPFNPNRNTALFGAPEQASAQTASVYETANQAVAAMPQDEQETLKGTLRQMGVYMSDDYEFEAPDTSNWWGQFLNSGAWMGAQTQKKVQETLEAQDIITQGARTDPSLAIHMRNAINGPDAMLKGYETSLNRDANVADLRNKAWQARAAGRSDEAALFWAQADDLETKSNAEILEENMNPWAEPLGGILLDVGLLGHGGDLLGAGLRGLGQANKAGRLRKIYNISLEQAEKQVGVALRNSRELAAKIAGTTDPDEAVRAYQGIVRQYMGPAARVLDKVGDIPIIGDVTTGILDLTPVAKAEMDTDVTLQGLRDIFMHIETKEDARRTWAIFLRNPMDLVRGVGGYTSPSIRKVSPQGILSYGPGMVGNNEFTMRYPLIGSAAKELQAIKSIQGVGPLNKEEFGSEVANIIFDAAAKFNGVRNPKDPKNVMTAAVALAKIPFDLQKRVMASMYLGLRPANWIRNALSGTAMLLADDLHGWARVQDMNSYFTHKHGTVEPFESGRDQAQGARKDIQGIFGKVPVLNQLEEAGFNTVYGDTRIGNVPFGEQAMRKQAHYVAHKRGFRGDWRANVQGQALGNAIRSIGLPKDIESNFLNALIETGVEGNKLDVMKHFDSLGNGGKPPLSLRGLGVPDDILSSTGHRAINKIFSDALPEQAGEAVASFQKVIDGERTWAMDKLRTSPKQVGDIKWLKHELPEEAAVVGDLNARYAQRAGSTPQEASKIRQQTADQFLQAQSAAFDSVREAARKAPNTPNAWSAINDYAREYSKAMENTRLYVDEMTRDAYRYNDWPARNQAVRKAWDTNFATITNLGKKYGQILADIGRGVPYQPKASWGETLERLATFDWNLWKRVKNVAIKGTDDANYPLKIKSWRGHTDSAVAEMWEAFRRFPTMDNYSVMTDAMEDLTQVQKMAATMSAKAQDDMVAGKLSKEGYYAKTNAIWEQAFAASSGQPKATARAMVASSVINGTSDSLRFDAGGKQYVLLAPRNKSLWEALDVNTGQHRTFAAPNSMSTKKTRLPQGVVDEYYRISGEKPRTVDRIGKEVEAAAAQAVPPPQGPPPRINVRERDYEVGDDPGSFRTESTPVDETIDIHDALSGRAYAPPEPPPTVQVMMPREARDKFKAAFNLSDPEADSVARLMDGRANAWARVTGKHPKAWYSSRFADIEPIESLGKHPIVNDEMGAAVTWLEDGRNLVQAGKVLREEYPSTTKLQAALHELAHVFHHDMLDLAKTDNKILGQVQEAQKWARKKGDTSQIDDTFGWTFDETERIADGFLLYLKEGRAPTPGLRNVFESFKAWLRDVLAIVWDKKTKLTPEARKFFGGLFDDGAQVTKGVAPPIAAEYDLLPIAPEVEDFFKLGYDEGVRKWAGDIVKGMAFSQATAGQKTLSQADVAFHQLKSLDELERVLTNPERVRAMLSGTYGTASNKQRQAIEQAKTLAARLYDNSLEVANHTAQDAANWAMLDFRKQRNIDSVLGFLAPFSFFLTRMPGRAAMAALKKPSLIGAYYDATAAIDKENEKSNVPERLRGTVPVPGFPEKRVQVKRFLTDLIPGMGYLAHDSYLRPEDINSEAGAIRAGLGQTIGVGPLQSQMLDWMDNEKIDEMLTLGSMVPFWRMWKYAQQGMTGQIEQVGPLMGGTQYDAGITGRDIASNLDLGDVTEQYMEALLDADQRGAERPPIPEGVDPDILQKYEEQVKQSGWNMFWKAVSGYMIAPVSTYTLEEQESRRMVDERSSIRYNEGENLMGSREAVRQYDENTGNEAKGFYNYVTLYDLDRDPNAVYDKAQYTDLSARKDEMFTRLDAQEEGEYAANPGMSQEQLSDTRGKYYDQRAAETKALEEALPRGAVYQFPEGIDSYAAENPQELNMAAMGAAQRQAVADLEEQGIPEPPYPGDGQSFETYRRYGAAKDEYEAAVDALAQTYYDNKEWVKKQLGGRDPATGIIEQEGASSTIAPQSQGPGEGIFEGTQRVELLPSSTLKADPNNPYFDAMTAAEQEYGLPAGLLQEVARGESSFNPDAESKVGAMGVMQIMPATWGEWSKKVGVDDPWNPEHSIEVGAAYLDWLRDTMPDDRQSLEWIMTAYNMGPTAAMGLKAFEDAPSATRAYANAIASAVNQPAAQQATNQTVAVPAQQVSVGMPFGDDHKLTQSFGVNPERYKSWGGHMGLDYSMPVGTELLATEGGVVVDTGYSPAGGTASRPGTGGFGNWIIIEYPNGYTAEYAHLSQVDVKAGDKVEQGQIIGLSGHTGVSDFPHLHFGVRKDGEYIDPNEYYARTIAPPTQMATSKTKVPGVAAPTGAPTVANAAQLPPGQQPTNMAEYREYMKGQYTGEAEGVIEQRIAGEDVQARTVLEQRYPELIPMRDEYQAIIADADREAYAEKNPLVRAVNFAANNPEEWAKLEQMFGPGVMEKWALIPPYEEGSYESADYYRQYPEAFLAKSWITGRPEPYRERGPAGPDTVFDQNFGKDYEEAKKLFGPNIWDVVVAYKQLDYNADKAGWIAFKEAHPEYDAWSAWWYEKMNFAKKEPFSPYQRGAFVPWSRSSYSGFSSGGYNSQPQPINRVEAQRAEAPQWQDAPSPGGDWRKFLTQGGVNLPNWSR